MSDSSQAYRPVVSTMIYEPHDSQQPRWKPPSNSLYVSHFISTWNSRGFEFGAVLFLAAAHPGTMLPLSIYALVRAAAAIVFSPWIGRRIDSTNRLQVVRSSIVGQRVSVALSCCGFLLLLSGHLKATSIWGHVIFASLVLLACIEKLCAVMNLVAVERDWVVVIAGKHEDILQTMNAQMRRIDLFCKLISPAAIALLDGCSSTIAVVTTFALNALTVGPEYLLIARVYRATPNLARQTNSAVIQEHAEDEGIPLTEGLTELGEERTQSTASKQPSRFESVRSYLHSAAFFPSFSLSILYLTVLSFSGQMTTYLLAVPSPHLTSTTVGLLRTVSTVFELSSTFIAPRLISLIGPIRAGIWCLSWQALCLTCGVGLLVATSAGSLPNLLLLRDASQISDTDVGVIALIITVMLSRIGLWSFDLIAQLLIQNSIESSHRGSFSSVEASLQSFFELCTFGTTIVWSKPEQFKFPAIISVLAVWIAGGCYAKFVRDQRGHLLHLPWCLDLSRSLLYKSVNTENPSRSPPA